MLNKQHNDPVVAGIGAFAEENFINVGIVTTRCRPWLARRDQQQGAGQHDEGDVFHRCCQRARCKA